MTLASQEDIDAWLAHIGVKGMRWGVRKEDASGGSDSSSGEIQIAKSGSVTRLTSPAFTASKGTDFSDPGALHTNAEIMKKFNAAADKLDEKSMSVWDPKTPAYSKYELEVDSGTRSVKVHLYLKPYKDGEVTLTDKMAFRKKPKGGITKINKVIGAVADHIPPEALLMMSGITHTDILRHADERTIQDVVDAMTPEQRGHMDLVVGAAVEDEDISYDEGTVQAYKALSEEHKNLIDFVVGGLLSEDAPLAHEEVVTDFLEHHGVKGMRWGVRKSDVAAPGLSKSAGNTPERRKAARAAVKAGTATLGEAHLAGLKSTGHRVVNGFLGDKTYWKRTAQIAGLSIAGIAASIAIPAALPAGVLAAVGAHVGVSGGFAGVGLAGSKAVLGQQMLTHLGLLSTSVASNIAGVGTLVTNTGRAIRGNARINSSAAALGNLITARQTAGNQRTRKILNQSGSLRKKNLRHEDLTMDEVVDNMTQPSEVGAFLEHHGIKGMRWGIRRERTSDGTVGSKIDSEHSDSSKIAEGGSHGGGGTHLSADAERVVNTLKKTDAEMSTREMKEAVERHRQLEAYNKLFNPHSSTNSALQAKVEALRLEKEYRILKRELKPTPPVVKLVRTAAAGFGAFKQIDSVLGGNLSKGLTRKLGLVQTSPLEKLQAQTSLFGARVKNIKAQAELAELSRLHKAILAESNHASSAPATSKTAAPAKTTFGGKHKRNAPTHINDLSKPLKGPKHKK